MSVPQPRTMERTDPALEARSFIHTHELFGSVRLQQVESVRGIAQEGEK